jgi:hypothetical protein
MGSPDAAQPWLPWKKSRNWDMGRIYDGLKVQGGDLLASHSRDLQMNGMGTILFVVVVAK